MAGRTKLPFLVLALNCALTRFAGADIYDPDDRMDLFQARNSSLRSLAEASVSLWDANWLSGRVSYDPVSKTYSLSTGTLEDDLGMCPDENFSKQPTGPFCSGALVGEDLVLTAGHCVENTGKCKETKFVFGFAVYHEGGTAPERLAENDVYECAELLQHSRAESSGADNFPSAPDYALIRLDRKAAGRDHLHISGKNGETPGTEVAYIGYPFGLPMKIAENATVQPPADHNFITADLDANSGASGAPVLAVTTGLIVGVIAKTHTPDIIKDANRNCAAAASYYLPESGDARGVAITRASAFSRFIPQ
ncbi:MAG: serine protease [Elusimicrobiales bacterium]|jgi:hypothetical protein